MICVHKCATCFVRLAKCVESYYGVLPRYNKVHAVHGNVCYFFSSVCSMSYSTVLYGIRVYAYRGVGCGVVCATLGVQCAGVCGLLLEGWAAACCGRLLGCRGSLTKSND